jgi:hypothetical protein
MNNKVEHVDWLHSLMQELENNDIELPIGDYYSVYEVLESLREHLLNTEIDPLDVVSLGETLYEIYEKDGKSGVYAYVNAHYPDWAWGYCWLCDCESPAMPDGYCAVCWGEKVQLENGETN